MKILKYIIIIIGIGAFSQAHAQMPQLGIKAGLNLSNMSVEGADDSNILPGFHVGAFTSVPIGTSAFSVQPEVLFSTKGMKAEYTGIVTGETTYRLNYIDIPVYLVYNLARDFNFHAGPYVGFLLNANTETDAEVLDFLEITNQDDLDKEYFNGTTVGLSAGLGFSLMKFDLGFNYSFGFIPVADEEKALEPLLGDAKNNVIQVYVGYRF